VPRFRGKLNLSITVITQTAVWTYRITQGWRRSDNAQCLLGLLNSLARAHTRTHIQTHTRPWVQHYTGRTNWSEQQPPHHVIVPDENFHASHEITRFHSLDFRNNGDNHVSQWLSDMKGEIINFHYYNSCSQGWKRHVLYMQFTSTDTEKHVQKAGCKLRQWLLRTFHITEQIRSPGTCNFSNAKTCNIKRMFFSAFLPESHTFRTKGTAVMHFTCNY
jgi:hypothetical protein